MPTRSKLYLVVITLIAVMSGTSCSQTVSTTANSNSRSEPKTQTDERAALINGESDTDWFLLTDREVVLVVSSDNKIYREGHSPVSDPVGKVTKTEITSGQLADLLKNSTTNEPPDRRIVYINVDGSTPYQTVVQLMGLIRKGDIDRVGLIAANEDRPAKRNAGGFEAKLPAEPAPVSEINVKPNPLMLVAQLRSDGRLTLNNEDMGKISDIRNFEARLKDVYQQREKNGVFRVGTNDIEKTIFIKAAKSAKYVNVLKIVSAVKRTGGQPIGMQLDDLE